MAVPVLDHDDGVVEHEADGGGDPTQRHQVERHPGGVEHKARDRHRRGDDGGGDQGRAEVRDEDEDRADGEHEAQQDGVPHAPDGGAHEIRLVVEDRERVLGMRPFELAEALADPVGDRDRVALGLAGHADQHRRLPVRGSSNEVFPDGGLDLRDVAEPDRHAVIVGDHDVLERPRLGAMALHDREDELIAVANLAPGGDHVGPPHGLRDAGQVQPMLNQRDGVHGQRVLPHLRAAQLHAIDPRQRPELGCRLVDDEVRHLRQRSLARRDGDADDRECRGVEQPGLHVAARRQARPDLLHGCLHPLEGRQQVCAPGVGEVDLNAAARRLGPDPLEAGHRGESGLERLRDGRQCLLDGKMARMRDHADAVERHLGEDRERHPPGGPEARRGQQGREAEDGRTVAAHDEAEAHGVPRTTASMGARSGSP